MALLQSEVNCTAMVEENATLPLNSNVGEMKRRNFERRLILHVRRHQFLYDSRHKHNADPAKEAEAWQKIAQKLNSDAATCKKRWSELRYNYQYYVYRLRYNFLNNQKKDHGKKLAMNLDSDLICLFKFMDNPKYFPIPHEIVEAVQRDMQLVATELDDDVIVMEKPTDLIVITEGDDQNNHNNSTENEFKVTKEMKILVEHIIKYPILYDSSLVDYNDYGRKSYIWNTIAMEIGTKATKLMKSWILMLTRYEWEIDRTPRRRNGALYHTELLKLLLFFKPYVSANPNTVCKQSFFLNEQWHEPLCKVKDIHNLIVRMRQIPRVVHVTESLLNVPTKSDEYFQLWQDVASMQGISAGQCEATWLTMRLFYWELLKMRQQNYQLADKWYFENIIFELYEVSTKSQLTLKQKQHKSSRKQAPKVRKTRVQRSKNVLDNAARSNNKKTIITVKPLETLLENVPPKPQTEESVPMVSLVPPLVYSQPQNVSTPLPKITSAISLAPKNLQPVALNGSLLIRPVGMAHQTNMKISQTTLPKPQTVEKSEQTVQLPFKLPKEIKVSKITKASASKTTHCSPPPFVISKARSIIQPSGKIIKPDITMTRIKVNTTTTTTTRIPPKPIICIDVVKTTSKTLPLPHATGDVKATNPTTMPPLVPLPRISRAVSLFNPNEVSIEVKDTSNGKYLFIEHPLLNEKYELTLTTVVEFIRAVLAVPLLHYKHHIELSLICNYWEEISKRFDLPVHICKACWNFLEGCFYQIAPIKDLMKPFHSKQVVWTQSTELFQLFNQHAISSGWLEYASILPEVIACIARFPCLYKDMEKNSQVTSADIEASSLWGFINARFPNIKHISTIWVSLKNVFGQYMSNIELGIDDKWHLNWWRILARLTFLVETRYSWNEPYFYIVSNKMMEEIQRCVSIEQ